MMNCYGQWRFHSFPLLLGVLVLVAARPSAAEESSAAFDGQVAPLLAARCLACHNPTDKQGKLDLTRREGALAGGESGDALVPGDLDASLIWQRIDADEMPPKKPLADAEKEILRAWIADGAKWGVDPIDRFRYTNDTRAGYDWWSLQPLRPLPTPAPPASVAGANPIDSFIVDKLAAQGLTLSPAADRRTLIRRLSFDLLGLPPTPGEVAAFLTDESASAYETLVDRLLASPHYGERWARHWLDVARFGESDGFEYDRMRDDAWPYRDWVIAALNDDLPYDEFARDQIAGDVVDPGDPAKIVATGFLVCGAHDSLIPSGEVMRKIMRQDEMEDLVGTVSQTFLGLTANCARCHDHKFDPIAQSDFYRLSSALAGVARGVRELPSPKAEQQLAPPPTATVKAFAVKPTRATVIHRLERGNPLTPAEEVSPGGIAALGGAAADFNLPAGAPDAERRLRLAAWIASPTNPLFSRVMVNRLWQHHLGVGIVDSPNDFGFSGGRPSHPELLDWLAGEFIRQRFRLKPMHKLIVMSATYRQGSLPNDRAMGLDAGNRLLWRYSPRRLEAEAVRDAMLLVSGELNRQGGGPGFRDFDLQSQANTNVYVPRDVDRPEFARRSIYRTWARGARHPLLDTFDCPDSAVTAPQRGSTTTPLQALSLLNSSFVLRMADRFAARVSTEAGAEATAQIRAAYLLALARSPAPEEVAAVEPFLAQNGLPALGRVLLNSNEFLYVE